jgi:hypothetical protein
MLILSLLDSVLFTIKVKVTYDIFLFYITSKTFFKKKKREKKKMHIFTLSREGVFLRIDHSRTIEKEIQEVSKEKNFSSYRYLIF